MTAGLRNSWAASTRQYQSTDSLAGPEAGRNDSGAQSQSKGTSSSSENDYDRDIAKRILAASLPFVPNSGWTKKALSEGKKEEIYKEQDILINKQPLGSDCCF